MRTLTADLAAVQQIRSPKAQVSCTVEARGQSIVAPAVEWTELVSNTGQVSFLKTAGVGLANGKIRTFLANAGNVTQETIDDPTSVANWGTPSSTITVVGFACLAIAALREPSTSTIRLFYIRSSTGNVQYIESTNNGSSWGSAVNVYTGGDAADDLVVAYISNGITSNGPWFVGFSTYNGGTGLYTPRFGYESGGGWVTHAYGSTGWRAAGIDAYGTAISAHRVLIFRQQGEGTSRLRVIEKIGSIYGDADDIDQTQAGLFGLLITWVRFIQLPIPGIMAACYGEGAQGRGNYQGIATLFYQDDCLVDEPIIFPSIVTTSDSAYTTISEGADGTTPNLYYFGDTVVYEGARQAATTDTLYPRSYIYDDHKIDLEFDSNIDTLYVGQILVVTRTLSFGSQSGSQTLRFYIVRVERGIYTGTDREVKAGQFFTKVHAVDPVGFIGIARCRRPHIANDGNAAGLAQVMRRLCARFGLTLITDHASLESASVLPITMQPAESLLGAAYRMTSQSSAFLVPRNNGAFTATLIKPPSSSSGSYDDDVHQYGQSGNQQPIIRVVEIADYRRLAFAYILGTYSTDPEDGASVGMSGGPAIANTRPLSYSLTNSRYNTFTRVEAAASAEAARQDKLPIDAILETWANLALEKYDMVEVTETNLGWSAKQFRVRRIVERWDRGRLTQELFLGDES